jgi:hypothetical protein
MERLIQYLDIIEDACFVIALLFERIRRILLLLGFITAIVVVATFGFVLALSQPPIGFALAALLTVTVLYRSATAGTSLVKSPVSG